MNKPQLSVIRIWVVVSVFLATHDALAMNLETGEPCDIGVMSVSERERAFYSWFLPPCILMAVSLIGSLMSNRRRKRAKSKSAQKLWAIATGVSRAIMVFSLVAVIAVLAIYAIAPEWMM